MKSFQRFLQDESGQGLVEYALIIALVSVVAIVALQLVGQNASTKLTSAGAALS